MTDEQGWIIMKGWDWWRADLSNAKEYTVVNRLPLMYAIKGELELDL